MPKINEAPSKPKTKPAKTKVNREAIDPKIKAGKSEITVCGVPIPEEAMRVTPEQMKEWLGWTELPDKAGALFRDINGTWVRLERNVSNRPFDARLTRSYAYDILKGNWELNGETLIMGDRGNSLSIQHRGTALEWAEQIRQQNPEEWEPIWGEGPVTIRSLWVQGISEEGRVRRTLDNGRPRTMMDVLFADFEEFADMKDVERKEVCRMAAYAIRMLWDRTKAFENPHSPYRTVSEQLDFLDRHPKLRECVLHIWEAYAPSGKQNKQYFSPGYAAALLYLMGSSNSDPKRYYGDNERAEDLLDWANWPTAKEFWNEWGAHAKTMDHVHAAMQEFVEAEGGSFMRERCSLLCKAWKAYLAGGKVLPKHLKLDRPFNEDGIQELAEDEPTGGIDLPDLDGLGLVTEAPPLPPSSPAGKGKGKKQKPMPTDEDSEELEYGDEPEEETVEEPTEDQPPALPLPTTGRSPLDVLNDLRDLFPDATLLYKGKDGNWSSYGEDARILADLLKYPLEKTGPTSVCKFSGDVFEQVHKKLIDAGHTVRLLTRNEQQEIVEYELAAPKGKKGKTK